MSSGSQLENKIALVTGGAVGLGKAICEAYVAQGAKVFIVDVDEARGAEAVAELGEDNAVFFKADVGNEEQVKACVEACIAHYGRLDTLVNNAGITGPWGGLMDLDIKGIEQMFNVNLSGVLLFTKYAAPEIAKVGGGSIINLSSTGASTARGAALQPAYNASKAGVDYLTRGNAYELGSMNIRVNSIQPGFMLSKVLPRKLTGCTEEQAEAKMPALREYFKGLQPIPIAGEPSDIAELAVFLASDASRFISGQVVAVDGGLLLEFAGLSADDWLKGANEAMGVEP